MFDIYGSPSELPSVFAQRPFAVEVAAPATGGLAVAVLLVVALAGFLAAASLVDAFFVDLVVASPALRIAVLHSPRSCCFLAL